MKPYLSYSLILAAAASGMAFGAETAYTTPVGYISIGNTTSPAIPAATDALISIPLDRPAVFAGTVASVNTVTNQITIAGTNPLGAADYIAGAGAPFIAKIGSGAKSGLIALITTPQNTSSVITVTTSSGESLSGIVAGDKIQIQQAWTVKSLFAGAVVPAGTQLLAYSGTSNGTNIAPDITYEYEAVSAGVWTDTADFLSADQKVLYPGEALVVRTLGGGPIPSMILSGTVPTSKSRLIIENPNNAIGQDNFLAYISPIGTTVGALGIAANAGDQILLLDDPAFPMTQVQNKGAAVTLEYEAVTPGIWTNTADFQPATGFVIPAGQGLIYRVAVGAPVGSSPWSSLPGYVPSL